MTKVSDLVSNLNDDFFKGFFWGILCFCNSKIDNFRIFTKDLSFWPQSLSKPPEAKLWPSVTSLRSQILDESVSFYIRYCFLSWDENCSIQRPLSVSRHFCLPPARILNWPKSPHRLGLRSVNLEIILCFTTKYCLLLEEKAE